MTSVLVEHRVTFVTCGSQLPEADRAHDWLQHSWIDTVAKLKLQQQPESQIPICQCKL